MVMLTRTRALALGKYLEVRIPNLNSVVIDPPSATVNQELIAYVSGGGVPAPTFSYQWKRDGSNVGTNNSKYTPDQAGSYTCLVTASNAAGSVQLESDPVIVTAAQVPDAFTALQWAVFDNGAEDGSEYRIEVYTNPASNGAAIDSYDQSIDLGTGVQFSGTGTPGNYVVGGATAGVSRDIRIRAGNPVGNGDWSDTKTVTTQVTPPNITNVGTITSGSLGYLGYLHSHSGLTYTGSGATVARQWKVDGVAIGGATETTYTPIAGDNGKLLTVEVTVSNGSGSDTRETSGITLQFEAPRLILAFPDYSQDVSDPSTVVDLTQHFEVLADPNLQSITEYTINADVDVFDADVFDAGVFTTGTIPDGITFDLPNAEMTLDWNTMGVYAGDVDITATNATGSVMDTFNLNVISTGANIFNAIPGGVEVEDLLPGPAMTFTAIPGGVRVDYA